MPLKVVGSTSGNIQEVDASLAARVVLYDSTGNPLVLADKASLGITPGTTKGLPQIGADYKTPVLLRATPDGSLLSSVDKTLLLHDECEGAAYSSNKWIQSLTTMTLTQANSVMTFNAGSSFATTVGAQMLSHRFMPDIMRGALIFRCRAQPGAHFANNLIELGFGSPASQTAASIANGALWRKDGTGQWIPVISINGSEVLGTGISNATFIAAVPVGNYAVFEVVMAMHHAYFTIYLAGAVVSQQILDMPANSASFAQTHLQACMRTYNSASTGTAVQLLVDDASVWQSDFFTNKSWPHVMVGMEGSGVSPTAYTQLASYANSAAPASATLSNTAAGYTTLGGQWQFAAVAGAETDYALFALQIPSPYAFYCTGVHISAFNMGATVATTPTLLQWALAVNSSAVSLATGAPYTPMRTTLGSHSFAIGAVVGANAPDIIRTFGTPIVCLPSRFFHVILKMPVGTATASQIVRGTVSLDGYFE